MSYDEQLVACTLNGMDLPLKEFSAHHARALAVHSYFDIPGGDVDDSGAEPVEVTLGVVFGGIAAHQNLRAFLGLVENTIPPLILTHPVYGPMPVAVRSADPAWVAGRRRHEVQVRVVRDTPTSAIALQPPIVLDVPERPAVIGLNADFAALAALLATWLSFINALRSAILSALNALAMLGYLEDYVTDVAASELGSIGDRLSDSYGTVFGGLADSIELPDDLSAMIDTRLDEIQKYLAWIYDLPFATFQALEDGTGSYDPGRFVSGRVDDGGPTEAYHASVTAYAASTIAAAASMTGTVAAAIAAADRAGTLTAASALRAVTAAHRRLLRAHRLARQVLPGGRAAMACASMAAELTRFYKGLKIRSNMRQAVALRSAPLFLVMHDYGVPPQRLPEVVRANALEDILAVPVGEKIWLPVVGRAS